MDSIWLPIAVLKLSEHLCLCQLYKHLGSRLDDRHLVQDGGSIISDDDLPIRLADLLVQTGNKTRLHSSCTVFKQ